MIGKPFLMPAPESQNKSYSVKPVISNYSLEKLGLEYHKFIPVYQSISSSVVKYDPH